MIIITLLSLYVMDMCKDLLSSYFMLFCQKHCVFCLCIYLSMRDEVCYHDILQTAYRWLFHQIYNLDAVQVKSSEVSLYTLVADGDTDREMVHFCCRVSWKPCELTSFS